MATTTTCPRSGGTVDRWTQPVDPCNAAGDWTDDPGPFREGETAECPGCGAAVAVTHRVTNDRSSGTQYVGNLAEH